MAKLHSFAVTRPSWCARRHARRSLVNLGEPAGGAGERHRHPAEQKPPAQVPPAGTVMIIPDSQLRVLEELAVYRYLIPRQLIRLGICRSLPYQPVDDVSFVIRRDRH
ncbi:MAG: hypothetical protein WA970_15255 [Gammaproteobacteria bacterium]